MQAEIAALGEALAQKGGDRSEAHFSELRDMLVATTTLPMAGPNLNGASHNSFGDFRYPQRTDVEDSRLFNLGRGLPNLRMTLKRTRSSRITLADRARDAGQWNLAARYYRQALDRNPRNPPIWVQYGHALKNPGISQKRRGPTAGAVFFLIPAPPTLTCSSVMF